MNKQKWIGIHTLNSWFSLLLMPGLILSGGIGGKALASERPNIVLIVVDDLGYGDLSSYGARDLRSPSIDALIASGTRCDTFYANCPVCSPTRAALLSGRYPELVGVPGVIRTHARDNWGFLAPSAVLLPNLLKRAGYHTAIVGKWHLGLEPPNTPLDRGFDHFYGFLGDMMDDYYRHTRHGNNYMRRQRQVIQPKGHATDLFSDWAIDYIKGRVGKEQPFFIYLAYNAPHTPIQPPDAWLERVKQREDNMTPSRAKLVALIEHLDEGIGRVVQSLADNGFKKNTLIVFVSDNGGQRDVGGNNGALRGTKGGMYEGGIRVPMCAVWPSKIPAGASLNTVGITMDLLPTLCEAAGVESVSNIDGRSLLRLLRGERLALRARDLFWVRREGGNRYMGQTIWAMRRGPWKLLQDTPNEPFRLYNLVDDPMEENDLAGSNKDKFKELGAGLRQHVQRSGAVPWQKSGGD